MAVAPLYAADFTSRRLSFLEILIAKALRPFVFSLTAVRVKGGFSSGEEGKI